MIENFLFSVLANVLTSRFAVDFAIVLIAYMYVFWTLWVVANVLHTRMHRLVYGALMWTTVFVGGLMDVFFNVFPLLAPLLFLDRPREWTLSMRLTRYLRSYGPIANPQRPLPLQRYRLALAVTLATHLIEPWGQGHIGLVRFGFKPADDALGTLLRKHPSVGGQFLTVAVHLFAAVAVVYATYVGVTL